MSKIRSFFPLTSLQRDLLARTGQLAGAQPAQVSLELSGTLDEERLSRAVAALFARHLHLHARFAAVEQNKPLMVLAPNPTPRMDVLDLRDEHDRFREERWKQLLQEDFLRRFDPARPPLVRF